MATIDELRAELLEWQSKESDEIIKRDDAIAQLDLLCKDVSLPVIGGQGNWFDAMRWLPEPPSASFPIDNITNVVRKNDVNGRPLTYLQACGGNVGQQFLDAFTQSAGNSQTFTFNGAVYPTEATGEVLARLNQRWIDKVKALSDSVSSLVSVRQKIRTLQKAISDVTTDVVVGNVASQVQGAVVQQAIASVTASFNKNKSTYTLIAVLVVSLLVFNLIRKRKANA